MAEMNDNKILDELYKSKDYEIALFTSFNFEISYFEKKILPLLLKNKIRTIDLFVDAKQFSETIKNSYSSMLGKHYHFNTVSMNASFHPKVILLLGKQKGKLIVSSANIKTSGYEFNNEVFNSYEFMDDDFIHSKLLKDTINFFISLYDKANYKDDTIYKYLTKQAFTIDGNSNNTKVINNLNIDVLNQIKNEIQPDVMEIDIAVPFYDDKLIAYQEIQNIFSCNNIILYIQNHKNSFPEDLENISNIINLDSIKLFDNVINNKNNNFYHGKLFRFKCEDKEYVLFGSSNCTQSALTKAYKDGGNIEFNILEENEPGFYDYYFNNFSFCDNERIVSDLKNFDTQSKTNSFCSFVYGYRNNEKIQLYFKCNNYSSNISVTYNNEEQVYTYENNLLIAYINVDDIDSFSSIFNIEIACDNIRESIDCWFIDNSYLYQFRNNSEEYKLIDYKLNDGLQKYMAYVQKINNTIIDNIEQLDYIAPADVSDDYGEKGLEEEASDNDEFILFDNVEDRYPLENTLNNIVWKANVLSKRYFSSIIHNNKSNGSTTNKIYEISNRSGQPREATTQEKRFGRHLKRIIREYVVGDKTHIMSYKNYKNIIGSVLDPIEQLYYVDKAEDFMDYKFILESKIKISEILLDKMIISDTDINKDEDISFILKSIIEVLKKFSDDNQLKDKIQTLISKLNKYYLIKDDLYNLLKNIDLNDIDKEDFAVNYFIRIDEIIGYKNLPQLKEYIYQIYGSDPAIDVSNKKLIIRIDTTMYQGIIAQKHILEIAKFIQGSELKINKVLIEFICDDDKYVSYDIEVVKTHINSVVQHSNNGSIRCKLQNGIYRVDYFNK